MNNLSESNASTKVSVTAATQEIALVVVESCIVVLLDIAALVGNLLVCLAFYKNRSLRTVTNYFVLSLAITDLSMAVLVMPLSTASLIATNGIVNNLNCIAIHFLAVQLAEVSLLTVVLLAINRYIRVVQPALYVNIFSKKRSVRMVVCVWIVAIPLTTVVLVISMRKKTQTVDVESTRCIYFLLNDILSKINLVIYIITIAVPSIIIVACYIKIYQTIRHHNTAAAPSSQGGHSDYGVEESKVTRMLTVVVVGFYLCWLPQVFTAILLALALIGQIALRYSIFYFNVPFLASSVLNPMVYGTMSQSFRNEFWKILRHQP